MRWPIVKVGKVCTPISQMDPSRNNGGLFRYVDIAGIDRESKVISRVETIPCSEAPSRARKMLQAGDVIVSTVRPNLNAIAQVPKDLDGEIASTGFAVLRANPNLVDSRYLYYRTQHREFVDFLVSNATGASYPAVSDEIVRNASIPLPPLSEQRRIVEILDEADRIRRLRKEANQKAERILPALFLKMFGDPATNPKGWDVEKLGAVCDVVSGATPRTDNPNYFGDDIFWATPKDLSSLNDYVLQYTERKLSENGFDNCSTRLLPKGTVLLSSRAPIGLVAIADMPVCTNQGFKNLIPGSRLSSWYVFAWAVLRKDFIKSQGRGATFKEISKEITLGFPIAVPPKSFQNKFSSMMEKFRSERLNLQKSESHIDELCHLLTQQAFEGQLTAKWRKAHMKELLAEMEAQARLLNIPKSKLEKIFQ